MDDGSQRRLLDPSEPGVGVAVKSHQLYVDVYIAHLLVPPQLSCLLFRRYPPLDSRLNSALIVCRLELQQLVPIVANGVELLLLASGSKRGFVD
jgi:hypothetical protein